MRGREAMEPQRSALRAAWSEELNLLYICTQLINYPMARHIKETPILFGSDARRFEERMQNPPKVSSEKRAQIRRSYETVIKMMVN